MDLRIKTALFGLSFGLFSYIIGFIITANIMFLTGYKNIWFFVFFSCLFAITILIKYSKDLEKFLKKKKYL